MIRRPLFLTGLMATGKSAVGAEVARLSGVGFVDLDRRIEEREGATITEIFAQRGEATFRAVERALVEAELADTTPRVVALGGGALLDRTLRLRALAATTVVTLEATIDELARRLTGDRSRPLLTENAPESSATDGSLVERLATLAEGRSEAYAEAHARIDTTARSVSAVAERVFALAQRELVAVPLRERTYVVEMARDGLATRLGTALADLAPTRVVYVTDDVVAPLVESRVRPALAASDPGAVVVTVPPGERYKTLASVERILTAAVEAPVDRRAVFVGVGGGVVTDMTGLAAALALRGARWIAVPTTVLAMVDASVGGKTAVDLGAAKNAVGAFHQPSYVLVDPALSRTEPDRQFRSGLAEVLKTALLGDADLYARLLQPGGAEGLAVDRAPELLDAAILASVRVKAGVVGRDERESGERAHLNLGHTIGHALEAEGGYERLTHGEGVALGLVAALRIGVALGVTPRDLAREIINVLGRLRLPTALDDQPLDAALRWVGYDKKRVGKQLRFVLLRAPGRVEMAGVALPDLPRLLTAP